MLSFKHFRGRDQNSLEELLSTYQRVIALLLNGSVVHAVRGQPSEYQRLDEELSGLRDEIVSQSCDAAELLVKTGGVIKALQDYNRRTSQFHQSQALELQKITAMLTGAIANLSVAGSTNVARLQELEKELENAADLEDVRSLKLKLSECLVGLREEKMRQQHGSERTVSGLLADLHALRCSSNQPNQGGPVSQAVDATTIRSQGNSLERHELPQASSSLDGTTGLGSRPAAEAAIAQAADASESSYAALFVIDHLHGLNMRYGRAIGDEVIVALAHHLTQKIRPQDRLYRWSGPAFLALLECNEPIEKVRRMLASVTTARLEKTVTSRDRTVLLPINFSWTLLPVPNEGKATLVVDKLDAFLTSKVGHEA